MKSDVILYIYGIRLLIDVTLQFYIYDSDNPITSVWSVEDQLKKAQMSSPQDLFKITVTAAFVRVHFNMKCLSFCHLL